MDASKLFPITTPYPEVIKSGIEYKAVKIEFSDVSLESNLPEIITDIIANGKAEIVLDDLRKNVFFS